MHSRRIRSASTYEPAFPLGATFLARFTAKVRKSKGGCWEWQAVKSASGYGRFSMRRRYFAAHRVSYSHFVGPIPDGLVLDHLCRNRACVNPDHLEPVTNRENIRRGEVGRGRGAETHNGRKTHCKRGHQFSDENTRLSRTGSRICRKCDRERAHTRQTEEQSGRRK